MNDEEYGFILAELTKDPDIGPESIGNIAYAIFDRFYNKDKDDWNSECDET